MGIAMGAVATETTPTDFKAGYLELDALKHKLADHGLQVLGPHQVAGNKDYTVVVYTSAELKRRHSFPRLTMTEFMKIMAVPGNIEDAFKAGSK